MEHHPFIRLEDNTEITYSNLKHNNGTEYVTVYFETPTIYGFNSMQVDYPDAVPNKIVGYTDNEIDYLMFHFKKVGHLAFEFAKEGNISCRH